MKWRSLQESGTYSDIRSLHEIFAERKKAIAKHVPPSVQAVHARAVSSLKSQELAAHALGIGSTAPAFVLPDHNGKPVSSADVLSKGRLVVCFIRGRWCPFCVGQMEAMNLIALQIVAAGASLVAISPQTEKQAFFMHNQHNLTFPLLVDAHNDVARRFGLAYRVPEEQQKLYRSTFVNLPFANGDHTWELPIPATFVIEQNGAIGFRAVDEDYTERPEPLEILTYLEGGKQ
jgi:peroxiredoxin